MEGRHSIDNRTSVEKLTKSRSLESNHRHSHSLDISNPFKVAASDISQPVDSKQKVLPAPRTSTMPSHDSKDEESSLLRTLALSQSVVLGILFISALYLQLKIYLLPGVYTSI